MFKVLVGSSFAGLSFWTFYKFSNLNKNYNDRLEMFYKKKDNLLNTENIKFLYSSLTLYYIYNINKNKNEDFLTYYELINFIKPKFISIKLSEKEYSEKYENFARSKTFMKDLSRVEYFLKLGEIENIKVKEFNIDEIYDLYTFYHCNKNKCKVLFSEIDEEELLKKKENFLEINEIKKQADKNKNISKLINNSNSIEEYNNIDEYRNKILVEKIMNEINPKNSIFKKPTENSILSLVDDKDFKIIPNIWKNKFKIIYNHQILDYDDNLTFEEEKKVFKDQFLKNKGIN